MLIFQGPALDRTQNQTLLRSEKSKHYFIIYPPKSQPVYNLFWMQCQKQHSGKSIAKCLKKKIAKSQNQIQLIKVEKQKQKQKTVSRQQRFKQKVSKRLINSRCGPLFNC